MVLGWERDAYIFVVEQLWEHPKLKRDTAAFVKGAVESLKKEETACVNDLKEDVSSFGRYDHDFCARYVSDKTGLSLERLGKAIAKPGMGPIVRQMMGGLLAMGPGLVMPQECNNDVVALRAFDVRYTAVGERGRLFVDPVEIIDADGKVNYIAGIYGATMNEAGIIVEFLHRPIGDRAVVNEAERLDKARYQIQSNLSDFGAKIWATKTDNKVIADYFAPGTGPKACGILRGNSPTWKGIVQAELAKLKTEQTLMTKDAMQEKMEEFATPVKEVTREAAKRIRERLRDVDKKARQRCSLE